MSKESRKSTVGRQSQLPFRRALQISVNSLKIRFGRSIITGGGIFLGIAFFAVVMTQGLMEWPVPKNVDPGYARIEGQVISPNDYAVWKLVPVLVGLDAGIPKNVIERVSYGRETFDLGRVVRGGIRARTADKRLALYNSEWDALEKIQPKLAFYLAALADEDLKVNDAVKFGVSRKVAKKLAGKQATFKGSMLVESLREDSGNIESLYVSAALDQDIPIRDAVRAGVPETFAKRLAGDGYVFRAAPLNDAITAHPDMIKATRTVAEHFAIYKSVRQAPIDKLAGGYAFNLAEVLETAKGYASDARKASVMVVNKDRRILANLVDNPNMASKVKLVDGDCILVPDQNSFFRTRWLVIMALLVCTVGIANSMLMSVTERFKEIGTMKCLGALDSFVVLLFMLESGMMGIVASVLGWLVGTLTIVIIAGFSKGWDIVGNIQASSVMNTFGWSVAVGLTLTLVATIAPAIRAAGMPAAVALRSEI